MANVPAFVGTGRIALATVSVANANYDGSGAIAQLIAGAAGGTRILEIDVKCAASSALGVINIFYSSNSGSTWKLLDSIGVTAVTATATVAPFETQATYTNLILPSATHVLGVSTTIAQAINVIALGGDF